MTEDNRNTGRALRLWRAPESTFRDHHWGFLRGHSLALLCKPQQAEDHPQTHIHTTPRHLSQGLVEDTPRRTYSQRGVHGWVWSSLTTIRCSSLHTKINIELQNIVEVVLEPIKNSGVGILFCNRMVPCQVHLDLQIPNSEGCHDYIVKFQPEFLME